MANIDAFTERQRFAWWVYVFCIVIACASASGIAIGSKRDATKPAACVTAALVLFMLDVLTLRTEVNEEGVSIRLGLPLPVAWQRIRMQEIRAVRAVVYRPLIDAGGWGIRFGRFDGQPATYWNARGNKGVFIETPSRRYVIGSQHPEVLCALIECAKESSRGIKK